MQQTSIKGKHKHDWVGKGIHSELCMWMDYKIQERRLDLELINKKKILMDFVVLATHRVKIKESEKIDKYWNLAKELKKL